MLSHDEDCIIAQCTPQGAGALALLRISGPSVRSLVTPMARLASKKSLLEVETHTIHYGSFLSTQGVLIDQVMFIVLDAPRTFTGQNVIEISCHNNPFIIEAIIAQVVSCGARLAQPGEFTRRAFQRGKLDLIQAEAIHELISAQTQHALKASLSQLKGSFSHWVDQLEKELIQAIAWCEASFEFLDEEVDFSDQIRGRLALLLTKISSLKETFNVQQQLRQGFKVVLIGSVNAGKSSLFNELLKQERAIVTPIAGTTRDSIEAGIIVGGNQWTLIDTAGLRETDDSIEQEGIKRSYQEAQKADCVILLVDGSRALSQEETEQYTHLYDTFTQKCIWVHAKADCVPAAENSLLKNCSVSVSAKTGFQCELLKKTIEEKVANLCAHLDSPYLLNSRQHALLVSLEKNLETLQNLMGEAPHYELISYHLQDALTCLSELTGKTISEAGLDLVFKEFCVGK